MLWIQVALAYVLRKQSRVKILSAKHCQGECLLKKKKKKKAVKKKSWIYGKRESKKWGCEQQESSFFADDIEK